MWAAHVLMNRVLKRPWDVFLWEENSLGFVSICHLFDKVLHLHEPGRKYKEKRLRDQGVG